MYWYTKKAAKLVGYLTAQSVTIYPFELQQYVELSQFAF